MRDADGMVPDWAMYAIIGGLALWLIAAIVAGRAIREARLKAEILEFKQKQANKPMPAE